MEPQPLPHLTPSQRYYQNHKEKRQAYGREYYQKNKDKILASIASTKKPKPVSTPAPHPSPPESPHIAEPIAEFKRRGITQKAPATVLFN